MHHKTRSGAPRQVERAREVLQATTDPDVTAVLRARVAMPTATLAEIAQSLNMTQAVYWGRLRRALRTPEQREREIEASKADGRDRIYGSRRAAGAKAPYVGSCNHYDCGARRIANGIRLRRFFLGQVVCKHVLAQHALNCSLRRDERCTCGATIPRRSQEPKDIV